MFVWIKKVDDQYINTDLLISMKVEGSTVVGIGCDGNIYPIVKASDSELAHTILQGISDKIYQKQSVIDIMEAVYANRL